MSVKGKEKAKVIDLTDESSDSESENSSSSSSSEDEEESITQEFLDSLLEKARQNADLQDKEEQRAQEDQEDVLILDKIDHQPYVFNSQLNELSSFVVVSFSYNSIPALDPGNLPPSYFNTSGFSKNQNGNESFPSGAAFSLSRDPLVESAESALAKVAKSSLSASSSLLPPPEFHHGKALTKRQRKELKNKTAGPDWFDLPAPLESDLPRLHREVEALRLRNQLDPKRFYRKEEGEGKGIKGLPKHFAIGKIITTETPFGGASGENLTHAERKRTLVDELVDDAEMKRYAKRKFEDLQKVRGARGRNTKNARKRKPKW
ncbi:Fcf2 pre-rRNA processing-domain-containing protein [Lentinula edodes]|uniref:Fcf2 pre-rRNA processing-domain-containing protein n=1 Tax=Lentinula edodes TaxID=5353 RepID=UPI001E8E3569|nr:Fcf2 pre-rRNA processing-domain-containing protein [Lentinula edodes]KAH7873202.1 Fcf2 pre-rRNA processing-domain-containing protein [Lentinula edodes]